MWLRIIGPAFLCVTSSWARAEPPLPKAKLPSLAPAPGEVRWGDELPPILTLLEMSPDELRRELERATSLQVTASYRTAAQALVLRALALKDPRVAPALAPFPVLVVVTPEPGNDPEVARALQREMVRALNGLKLPAVEGDQPHAGVLRITLDVEENDTSNSHMDFGDIRSFAIRVAGALYRPDGTLLLEYGSVRSSLGISIKAAAASDFDRNAAAHHRELIDQLARLALSLP